MIRWPEIAPFLLDLFGALGTDPSKAGTVTAEWTEGKRKAISDTQKIAILLKLTRVSGVARDENREEFFEEVAGSISSITQTGPGGQFQATGPATASGHFTGEISVAGGISLAQFDWTYGSEFGTHLVTGAPTPLGTTGLSVGGVIGSGAYVLGTTYEFDAVAPTPEHLDETLHGLRKFTIQVQVHSVERDDATVCQVALDRIRVGLRRRRTIDALVDQNIALIDILDSVKANYPDHGRIVSAGSMDVVFYASFADKDPIAGNWIESIAYDSHAQDTSGVELPVPPNVVGHIVSGDTPP